MSKMNWIKIDKRVDEEGTTIVYGCSSAYTIESRKRKIPHANGYPGTWDHTSYFVIDPDGKEIKICTTLKDAKDYVEDL